MKVTGYHAFFIALPSRRPHNWATKMHEPIGRHYILKLETDAGIEGWGETPPLATWGGPHGMYYGETLWTVDHVIREYLFPALKGLDPREIAYCHMRMDRAIKGHPYAKAAIDLALHDIAGKAAGTPVYRLLGGKLRDAIPVCHSLGIMDVEAAVEEAEHAAQEGVTTIKCKTGLDPERDVTLVRMLRDRLGHHIAIRVDANEGYATPWEAVRVIRRMEPYEVLLHEQPVAGFEALAEVARAVSAPIMADESAWFPQDILRLWELKAASMISVYYAKPGGLYRARQVINVAKACGFLCDIGGSIEMGIGVAANLHLAASTEILACASVCPVPNVDGEGPTRIAGVYYVDDIIRTPLRYEGGFLHVPNGPGLGVEVDDRKIAKYATWSRREG